MKMKLMLVMVMAGLLLTAGCQEDKDTAKMSDNPKSESKHAQKDIVETAISAGNFKTLVKALTAAGLVDTLKGDGPFTVFAPTDAAFAKMPPGALDDLLKPQNRSKLQATLKYHVVGDKVMAKEVMKMSSAKPIQGKKLSIRTRGDTVMVDNAKITKTDIVCSNGVIHVIDTVLTP